jgi:Uma2 family endonuclease
VWGELDIFLAQVVSNPTMATTISTFTAEQLLAKPSDGWRYELVNGELRRMSRAGEEHGRIAMNLGARLWQIVREQKLGVVYTAETGFLLRRNPDTVRAPDVAFIKGSRQRAAEGFFPGAPDLAVEVVSPSDSYFEVEEKVFEWLGAGCGVVLVVSPRKRVIAIYRGREDIRRLSETDTLDLSFVIAGFSVAVRDLFE